MINAFSEEVVSVSVSLGKENEKIVGYSHKAPKFFGYTRYEFSMIKAIDELIPD